MSRQHIIPRFILKGFASRVQKKEIFTWVYRTDGNIFETNIINVAVERFFYGPKGELCVDEEVTEFEGAISPLIDEIRSKKNVIEITDNRISDLICHLVTRTKHLRDSLRESFEILTDKIGEYLSDFNNVKPLILKKPDLIKKEIKKQAKEINVPRADRRRLQKALINMYPSFLDTQKDEMETFSKTLFEKAKSLMPKLIKEGHIKGLSQNLIPKTRVEDYRALKWFKYDTDEIVIIGDMCCLFEVTGTKEFKPLNFSDDKIMNVYLPISSRQIILGTSLPNASFVEPKLINEQIAKCSREFFVCSENSSEIASLIPLLGEESEIYTKEEIAKITKDIFNNY